MPILDKFDITFPSKGLVVEGYQWNGEDYKGEIWNDSVKFENSNESNFFLSRIPAICYNVKSTFCYVL